MSTSADTPITVAAPSSPTAQSSASPLLFVFLVPLLIVVGMVLWIGSALTWAIVFVTIAAIAGMTGLVMASINRLLNDGDGEGHPDVFEH